jgi:hypothetical protein
LCPIPSKTSASVVSRLLYARKNGRSQPDILVTIHLVLALTMLEGRSKAQPIPHTSHSIIPAPKISHNANLVSARVPDTLEETVALGEAVHAVVALAHCAHEAAKRIDLVLAGVTAVLVHLGNADLNRAVILGLDDAVGRTALAGDVPTQRETVLVCVFPQFLHSGRAARRRGLSPESLRIRGARLQVDKLAAVVLHFDGCVGGERRVSGGIGGREGADLSCPCLLEVAVVGP